MFSTRKTMNEIGDYFKEIDFNSENISYIREKEFKLAESLKKKIKDLFDSNSKKLSDEQKECLRRALERFGVGVKKIVENYDDDEDNDDENCFHYSYYSIEKMQYFGDLPSKNMLKKYLSLLECIDLKLDCQQETANYSYFDSDLTYEKIFEELNKNLYGMFEAKNDLLNLLARKKFIRNLTTYKIISDIEMAKSILVSGVEGVGKTSLVKEMAKILKRKVI